MLKVERYKYNNINNSYSNKGGVVIQRSKFSSSIIFVFDILLVVSDLLYVSTKYRTYSSDYK